MDFVRVTLRCAQPALEVKNWQLNLRKTWSDIKLQINREFKISAQTLKLDKHLIEAQRDNQRVLEMNPADGLSTLTIISEVDGGTL
jgi:ribosomal protein L28